MATGGLDKSLARSRSPLCRAGLMLGLALLVCIGGMLPDFGGASGLMQHARLGLLPEMTISFTTPLTFGQTIQRSIGAAGELDAYTFAANAGDVALARMSVTSGGLDPHLRIYGPDGTMLCEASYPFEGSAEISSCALSTNGTYALLVGDYGGTDTGGYNVHLDRVHALGPDMQP